MIQKIVFCLLVFIAIVFGLSVYLQPNDLSGCAKIPSLTENCQAVDAIVAVSGGDTNARANQAVELYKNGWSNTIIFSGAAQDKTGPSNAAAMKLFAVEAGVPESNIFIDEYSETTEQNAKNTRAIFTKNDIKSVILVTAGYHQRRASLEFKKIANGVKVLNYPVSSDKNWSVWWWINPYCWWLVSTEILKIIVFYVVGIW